MTVAEILFTIFICVIILVPLFIVLVLLPISWHLDNKYTEEWKQNNPEKIALLEQYDKELKELEPQIEQYNSTKDAIDNILKELDYHYDNTEQKARLEKLRKDYDQLEKVKREERLKLAFRNAICTEWREYVNKKMPKWLRYN